LSALGLAVAAGAIGAFQPAPAPSTPIDAQNVQDQQDMTWAGYRPIPGVNWADPSLTPSKKNFKIALIAVDFPDQPFVISRTRWRPVRFNPKTAVAMLPDGPSSSAASVCAEGICHPLGEARRSWKSKPHEALPIAPTSSRRF
jgi:hypothetical protein